MNIWKNIAKKHEVCGFMNRKSKSKIEKPP